MSTVAPSDNSTQAARAFVWIGILRVAKQIRGRAWCTTEQSSVVQLRAGTPEAPVYFIGAGLSELRLAQLMTTERSIFGVEVPWPSAWRAAAAKYDLDALPSLEELVAPYVAAISEHVASSPCVLAGYSFHGLMAFEAAHRINEQGGRVQTVLLLDAPARYPVRYEIVWQKLQKDWSKTASQPLTKRITSRLQSLCVTARWMLVEDLKALKRRVLKNHNELTMRVDDHGAPWEWQLLERVYSRALRFYRLCCLDCRGILFLADSDDDLFRTLDRSLGWSNLFRKGLEIIRVPGNHLTIMRETPRDLTLAQAISEALDRQHKPVR